jgi:hypothetical protein
LFLFFELAGRQFPQPASRGMPELAQQADATIFVQCNDSRTTGMADNFQFQGLSVGKGQGFDAESDDPTLEYRSGLVGQWLLLYAVLSCATPIMILHKHKRAVREAR